MSSLVTYNPSDPNVANVITAVRLGVDPQTLPNTLIDPDYSLIGGIQNAQSAIGTATANVGSNQITPFTTQQQTTWNAAIAAALVASQRAQAAADVSTANDLGKLIRASDDVILNEFNTILTWINSFMAAVNAATSLADLKTRVAQITVPANVTLAQAKTAIINDINSGNAD